MPLDWRIERFDTLISTQDTIKGMAAGGAAEGAVVQAASQSGGQGRHGRVWNSPSGNLYMSMLLRPQCAALVVGQLSLMTAIALARAIDRADIELKWPNDILLFDESGRRKKCAGILLESELSGGGVVDWVVIGVGVNLVSAPAEIGAYLAGGVDLDAFRDAFLGHFTVLYAAWKAQGFAALRAEWLALAHTQGQALSVKVGERLESGFFHDIDGDGNLRLRQNDGGLKVITSGDVYVTGD